MIEIKEEDIILDWKGMDEIHIFYTEKQLGKQLKQQILQDHEDAKKWNHVKDIGPSGGYELLATASKDRQMIEKIKECLKNVHFTDEGEVLIKQIEDILEKKK